MGPIIFKLANKPGVDLFPGDSAKSPVDCPHRKGVRMVTPRGSNWPPTAGASGVRPREWEKLRGPPKLSNADKEVITHQTRGGSHCIKKGQGGGPNGRAMGQRECAPKFGPNFWSGSKSKL